MKTFVNGTYTFSNKKSNQIRTTKPDLIYLKTMGFHKISYLKERFQVTLYEDCEIVSLKSLFVYAYT